MHVFDGLPAHLVDFVLGFKSEKDSQAVGLLVHSVLHIVPLSKHVRLLGVPNGLFKTRDDVLGALVVAARRSVHVDQHALSV